MVGGFICVHIGAGYHSEKYETQYMHLCKAACLKGVEVLRSGGTALEGAVAATVFLEDSPLTNAGYGSNLTFEGGVECDASAMAAPGRQFGAIGAVAGVRNPIQVAAKLLFLQNIPLSLGRIPPCFLVGEGARQWAEKQGLVTVCPDTLITEKASKQHMKYKKRALDGVEDVNNIYGRLDTVGAVCIDTLGHVASTASSGGILLKHPGRVGQAGVFGCGCWADGNIGVTVSGGGEDLIRCELARLAASALASSPAPGLGLKETVTSFEASPNLGSASQRLCGVLAVVADDSSTGELVFAHTTRSMGVGYMAASHRNPKSVMSRKVNTDKVKVEALKWT